MAYMELVEQGTNYIRVRVAGMGTNAIGSLTIYCTNGASYNASYSGGSSGNYYSTTQTFTGLSSGTSYGFYASGKTSGGTAISVSTSYFSTSQPSAIYPAAPSVSVVVSGLSVTVTVTARADTYYIQCSLGSNTKPIEYMSNGSTTYFYFSVSSYDSSYDLYVYAYSTTGHSDYTYRTVYTGSPPAIYPTAPTISTVVDGLNVTVTVTARADTYYVITTLGGNQKPITYMSNGDTNYFYFTVSSYNTSYDLYVTAYSTTGHTATSSRSVAIGSPPAIIPTAPTVSTVVNGKSITVTITARANTTKVKCVLGGNTSKADTTLSNGQTTYYYFDVSAYATQYSYTVTAYSSTGHTAETTGTVTSGADNVAPTISLVSTDRYNALTVNFSASDDTALRSSNTFYTELSGGYSATQSSPTYYNKGYLGQTARQVNFSTDGNGNAFIVGYYYYWRITVYDSSNNAKAINGVLQFARTRPSNFSWTYTKSSGGDFNLTAAEWNSLILRLNEFRQYKGLTNLTFTQASTGSVLTAVQFNQIVNALNTLSPSTSSPATQSTGNTIYASLLNGLVSSLNSIS